MGISELTPVAEIELALVAAINGLKESSERLIRAIEGERPPVVSAFSADDRAEPALWEKDQEQQRKRLVRGFRDFENEDDVDPRCSTQYMGVIAVSAQTIEIAEEVNAYKTLIKGCKKFLNIHAVNWRELDQLRNHRYHYKKLIRRIVVAEEIPYRVNFSWRKKGVNTKRQTATKAIEQAASLGSDIGVKTAIDRISKVGKDVAVVQKIDRPSVLMTLSFHKGMRETPKKKLVPMIVRKEYRATLPALIPNSRSLPKVTFRDKKMNNIGQRKIRSDVRIDYKSKIKPINGYWYLQ